jgi:hypothetical protein
MSGNSGPGLTPDGTMPTSPFEALSPGTTALGLASALLTDFLRPMGTSPAERLGNRPMTHVQTVTAVKLIAHAMITALNEAEEQA